MIEDKLIAFNTYMYNHKKLLKILLMIFLSLGILGFYLQYANAELSIHTTDLEVPSLEKSKMQTIYEDQEKKIMLPYDPERINHFMMVGILLTFIGGMGGGYILNEILRRKEKNESI